MEKGTRSGWRRGRAATWLAAVAVAAAACTDGPTGPGLAPDPDAAPVDLTREWRVVAPEAVGVSADRVQRAVEFAADIPRLRSLVAARHGRLFLEEYFGGAGAATLHDVRSVTKSVVGTLAALAQARGHIGSLDDRIESYVAPAIALGVEERDITFRHLLTMTGGFEWDESGGLGDYIGWIGSDDHLQWLIDRPIVHQPGTVFTYNSAAVHLLGVAIQEAVGEPLWIFAARELFVPIGIEAVQWEPLGDDYVNGGSGLDLRARDLARLGQLFLQDGVSGTRRVLPEGWVERATAPAFPWRASFGALAAYTYGHLWWVDEGQPDPAFLAWGYGGQFIYVVPELSLVVAAATDWHGLTAEGGALPLQREVLSLIIEHVLEAVRAG